MKYTLRQNNVIVNIVEGEANYQHPFYDTSAYQPGDSIPVVVSTKTHETSLTAFQWIKILTDAEEDALATSTANPVKRALNMLRVSAGEPMDAKERPVIKFLNAIENDSIITPTRKAELRLGKPL